MQLVDRIRLSIPGEVVRAQELLDERERLLHDTREHAEGVVERAETAARELGERVQAHAQELSRRAQEEAAQLGAGPDRGPAEGRGGAGAGRASGLGSRRPARRPGAGCTAPPRGGGECGQGHRRRGGVRPRRGRLRPVRDGRPRGAPDHRRGDGPQGADHAGHPRPVAQEAPGRPQGLTRVQRVYSALRFCAAVGCAPSLPARRPHAPPQTTHLAAPPRHAAVASRHQPPDPQPVSPVQAAASAAPGLPQLRPLRSPRGDRDRVERQGQGRARSRRGAVRPGIVARRTRRGGPDVPAMRFRDWMRTS